MGRTGQRLPGVKTIDVDVEKTPDDNPKAKNDDGQLGN
jgi:hypothetical protein